MPGRELQQPPDPKEEHDGHDSETLTHRQVESENSQGETSQGENVHGENVQGKNSLRQTDRG